MAGSKSNYLENKILDHVLKVAAFSQPASLFVALFTVAPTDAGGGTEVSGGSYARTAVTFGAASGGVSLNSGAVTFPTPTAGWGTVVAWGLFDASSAGNLLYWGDVTVAKTVNTGDTVSFPISSISISED